MVAVEGYMTRERVLVHSCRVGGAVFPSLVFPVVWVCCRPFDRAWLLLYYYNCLFILRYDNNL